MSRYSYPPDVDVISGFGGDYEEACQKMVIAGMQWLDEHPLATPEFKEFKNIFGLTTDENEAMKEMQKAMNSVIKGATGAMMQACTKHIIYASKHGWDKYLEDVLSEE